MAILNVFRNKVQKKDTCELRIPSPIKNCLEIININARDRVETLKNKLQDKPVLQEEKPIKDLEFDKSDISSQPKVIIKLDKL